jgi:colicin import membrane protein
MNWFKLLASTAIMTLCSACASPPPVVDTNVKIDFPLAAPITSVEQADTVLDAVSLARAQIDWRYRQKEQICYSKFFMNSCLKDAKDERRHDLAIVKKSEVAANYFKRKNDVEEMDRNLVEKNVANPLPVPNPGPVTDPSDPDPKIDTK